MEPLNCVVKLTESGCEIWNGEQFQTGDQFAIAKYTGSSPEQISSTCSTPAAVSGRRASSASDYVLEAVSIAVALVRAGKPGIP
jgi:isoquinoline 1-oxidoreductase beta subunit